MKRIDYSSYIVQVDKKKKATIESYTETAIHIQLWLPRQSAHLNHITQRLHAQDNRWWRTFRHDGGGGTNASDCYLQLIRGWEGGSNFYKRGQKGM